MYGFQLIDTCNNKCDLTNPHPHKWWSAKYAVCSYCSNILKLKMENNNRLISRYISWWFIDWLGIILTPVDNLYAVFDILMIMIRFSNFVILAFLWHLYRFKIKSYEFKIIRYQFLIWIFIILIRDDACSLVTIRLCQVLKMSYLL